MIYIHAVGLLNALGRTREEVYRRLLVGESPGIQVERGWLTDGRAALVGRAPDPVATVPARLAHMDCRNNRMLLEALEQIRQEVDDCLTQFGRDRVAIVLGTSTSGLREGEIAVAQRLKSSRFPEEFHYVQQELGTPSEFLAAYLETTGVAFTISTACSSSGRAFVSAKHLIETGICDAAIVGGADSLCQFTLNGFHALEALSEERSNPFSLNRNGINIGEASALFVLRREPSPIALLGAGESSDAYHSSAPRPDGSGAEAAMRMAMADAGLAPDDIGYVNLHGTGTVLNDSMEALAVSRLLGNAVPCSSTKPLTGHTLGAAGATEAALCCLVLGGEQGVQIPAHLWDGISDPELPPIALVAQETAIDKPVLLSNSFGFGGNNVSLILGRTDAGA